MGIPLAVWFTKATSSSCLARVETEAVVLAMWHVIPMPVMRQNFQLHTGRNFLKSTQVEVHTHCSEWEVLKILRPMPTQKVYTFAWLLSQARQHYSRSMLDCIRQCPFLGLTEIQARHVMWPTHGIGYQALTVQRTIILAAADGSANEV